MYDRWQPGYSESRVSGGQSANHDLPFRANVEHARPQSDGDRESGKEEGSSLRQRPENLIRDLNLLSSNRIGDERADVPERPMRQGCESGQRLPTGCEDHKSAGRKGDCERAYRLCERPKACRHGAPSSISRPISSWVVDLRSRIPANVPLYKTAIRFDI